MKKTTAEIARDVWMDRFTGYAPGSPIFNNPMRVSGRSFIGSGFVYAPYVPLMVTPTIFAKKGITK